ncbi:MAG: PhoH family protein [Hydrogenophaga sp.]|jgi:PhoH-like ATPase|uniref:PhoH family protein n=1 Tax=Hydrogenophaga sp. TaxID=1904254 RepID=UPI000EE6CF2A|nr:PhoH family protein [Hydrogenophaga sp.]MDD3784742.1 PhoH family protein [Hydrogenophaga sp.]MDX9969241.1 PhoH family protein [Hydrogenophaga sp.]HAJ13757.1 phosphate starvation-inducible protein PhoH [Comamonadaceae bacterium]
MPLPPAPNKRATLLAPEFYHLKAAADPRDTVDEREPAERVDGQPMTEAPAATARPRKRQTPVATAPTAPRARGTRRAGTAPAENEKTADTAENRPAVPTPPPSPAQPPAARTHETRARPVRGGRQGPARLFVLDTNVLLHDPTSLFRFEEHDIFLPMIVLEELDGHKKGMTEVARNGRQTSRTLDALVAQAGGDMAKGLKLSATGHQAARGLLFFQTEPLTDDLPASLPQGKADNQILGVVHALRQKFPQREVILVSKDINMRVKARALGLAAEDYENDKTLDDGELLYSGSLALPQDFWTRQSKTIESWQSGSHTYYRVSGPAVSQLHINQFVYFEAPGEPSLYARVTEIRDKTVVLRTLKDYTHLKNAVWGVTSRNREQNFALNLLMDPEVDFVTLAGTAGTGKTLMALASGLTQVLDDRRYTEIIMTRATVSVGEDIGFLPGTEEEKMGPWMGALDDNLEFLAKGDGGNAGEWGRAATNELIRSRIKVKSMNFMRGRTFMNKYVIIDEAQNLTPKQMKTLITRAGPGTKIICMGNLAQIDTPYLTEGSSGLTYAVDRFKGWPHSGHITLARGERSRLADYASEVL